MKIMHLCTGMSIDFNGGITNYVRSLANTQVKNGYEVTVISFPIEVNNNDFYIKKYKSFFIRPFRLKFRKNIFAYKNIEKLIKNNEERGRL